MRTGLLILGCLVVVACSDNAAGPHAKTERELLVGAWHALSVETDGAVIPLPEGNTYWYFDTQGRYCDKYRTAYGEYRSAFCGRVSTALVLAEGFPDSTLRTWQLSLSSGADTLVAELLSATVAAADRWTLVPASDRTDADCFCD
jgi:hypothetical protein